MSFSDKAFNKFNGFNPESKLNDFRKRFEDLAQESKDRRKMFFDSRNPNAWTRNPFDRDFTQFNPMTRNESLNKTSNDDESDAIPIKVIHETSDERPAHNYDRSDHSDGLSSVGSSNSHNSSSSSGSVFQNQSQEATVEPRVHHIPIKVEPRDGSSSSGYTSEPNATPVEQPLSRSESNSSRHSFQSTGSRASAVGRSPSPPKSVSSQSSASLNSSNNQRVHQIPVQIVKEDNHKSKSQIKSDVKAVPKVKTTGLGQSKASKAKSGPFVTRIPVVGESVSSEAQSAESHPPVDQQTIKQNPLEFIQQILTDFKKYEIQVQEFKGTQNDKEYKFLDEMLTRIMIKLDTIETEGKEDMRKARKEAIMTVNKCINLLESKVSSDDKKERNERESVEQMIVSAPEPSRDETNVNQSEEHVEPMQVDQKVDNGVEQELSPNETEKLDTVETNSSNNTSNDAMNSSNVTINGQTNKTNGERKETAV